MKTRHRLVPTPTYAAWLYATARTFPDVHLREKMQRFADEYPVEMAKFSALPQDWEELTDEQHEMIYELKSNVL